MGGSSNTNLQEEYNIYSSSTVDLNQIRSDKDSDKTKPKNQTTMTKSNLPAKEMRLISTKKGEAGRSEERAVNVSQKVKTILHAFSADQDIFWFR